MMNLPSAKYIRIYSDIHLDFDVPNKKFRFDMLWMPEELETDSETILILAGDIWHAEKPFSYFGESWFEKLSKKFKYVICILGNHDLWNGNFPGTYKNFKEEIKSQTLDNVFLLQDETLIIGNQKFIGGTLWTDFFKSNPQCMYIAENGLMKDYKYIRYGSNFNKLRASIILKEHYKTKDYIFQNAKKDHEQQKIWVLTHHLPSFRSIDSSYHRDDLILENALYYSDLDILIENSEIDYWVHGHSHHAQDYEIGEARVIANPRGYKGEESGYNPWFLMQLDE
jgi:predicted phosphodiesterase